MPIVIIMVVILSVLATEVAVAGTTVGAGLVDVAGGKVGGGGEVGVGGTAVGGGKVGCDTIAVGGDAAVGAGAQAAIETTARMSTNIG